MQSFLYFLVILGVLSVFAGNRADGTPQEGFYAIAANPRDSYGRACIYSLLREELFRRSPICRFRGRPPMISLTS